MARSPVPGMMKLGMTKLRNYSQMRSFQRSSALAPDGTPGWRKEPEPSL